MPDGKPVIGPVPSLPNIYLAAGHEGGGLAMVISQPAYFILVKKKVVLECTVISELASGIWIDAHWSCFVCFALCRLWELLKWLLIWYWETQLNLISLHSLFKLTAFEERSARGSLIPLKVITSCIHQLHYRRTSLLIKMSFAWLLLTILVRLISSIISIWHIDTKACLVFKRNR